MLLLVALLIFGYAIALRAPAPVLDFFCLVSAVMLIVAALYDQRLRTALEHDVPQFLGQISYSLYLIHLPVLFVSYLLLEGGCRPLSSSRSMSLRPYRRRPCSLPSSRGPVFC